MREIKTSQPWTSIVVDDNHDIVLTMMALLSMEGYETKGCYNGGEVIALVLQYDPDVVLLNIGLPGVNRWELAPTNPRAPG